jgi:hypothetical protein
MSKECKCGLATQLVGDGCEVCNPEMARDIAYERIEELEQVSGEMCDKCGFAMKFPDEPCRCELESEVARLTAQAVKEGNIIGNQALEIRRHLKALVAKQCEIDALRKGFECIQDEAKYTQIVTTNAELEAEIENLNSLVEVLSSTIGGR